LCKTTYANKYLLSIIYKFVNVVYEKTTYEGTIFVSENLWIKIKTYFLA